VAKIEMGEIKKGKEQTKPEAKKVSSVKKEDLTALSNTGP